MRGWLGHADMFAWRESDYVPLVFGGPVPELDGLPEFDWAVQFADPTASLYMQMKTCCAGHATCCTAGGLANA